MTQILVIKNLRSFAAKIFDMGKSKPTKKAAAKAKPAASKTKPKAKPAVAKAKPAAKKAAAKAKPAVKKATPKPVAKKVVNKTAAKAAKPTPKKVSKPIVKKSVKPAVKKNTAKPTVKVAPKKVSAKPVAKKATAKPAAKKEVKAVAKPAVKAAAKKATPAAKPVAKSVVKQVVQPAVKPATPKQKAVESTTKKQAASTAKNDVPQMRYSDEDLKGFKTLIETKLDAAREELKSLKESLDNHNESLAGNKSWNMEEGSDTTEMEYLMNQISRQHQYLRNLEAALVRIENKTYGICRVTGKLIAKERLRLVPHATLSVEAKLNRKPDESSPALAGAPMAGSDEIPSFSAED